MPNPNASAKYKKKSDTVDAISVQLVLTSKLDDLPQWVIDAFTSGMLKVEGTALIVGPATALSGDMLVKTGGGLVPLKVDQFNALYESA